MTQKQSPASQRRTRELSTAAASIIAIIVTTVVGGIVAMVLDMIFRMMG